MADEISTLLGYPNTLTKQEDGSYLWHCSIDPQYYRDTMRPGLIACVVIGMFMLAYGTVLSYMFDDMGEMYIVVICVAVFLLISYLTFWIFTHFATDPKERYKMTEDYVKTGSGKSSSYFEYKKIRKFISSPDYIEIRGKIKRMRIYAANEDDLNFVRCFIQTRLPGDAVTERI